MAGRRCAEARSCEGSEMYRWSTKGALKFERGTSTGDWWCTGGAKDGGREICEARAGAALGNLGNSMDLRMDGGEAEMFKAYRDAPNARTGGEWGGRAPKS